MGGHIASKYLLDQISFNCVQANPEFEVLIRLVAQGAVPIRQVRFHTRINSRVYRKAHTFHQAHGSLFAVVIHHSVLPAAAGVCALLTIRPGLGQQVSKEPQPGSSPRRYQYQYRAPKAIPSLFGSPDETFLSDVVLRPCAHQTAPVGQKSSA